MTSTYHPRSMRIRADNPLESAQFARPAEQRARTREDPVRTAKLVHVCRYADR